MAMTCDELRARLAPYGQQHLLACWDRLDPAARRLLADEIESLDWEQLAELLGGSAGGLEEDFSAMARRAETPPAIRPTDKNPPFSAEAARRRGAEALRAGEVGVLLVAGGQGSRLGFEHPKGMYAIGPLSGASLFQIHFEKIAATRARYGRPVPLYLMTSPATHDETVAYLAAHDRFGLPADEVRIFCQGTLPAIEAASGRILLAEPGRLALSPDGHGGMLAALSRGGALRDMTERGLKQLFYFQVDNPLVAICDPAMIGSHLLSRSEYTLEVVAKQMPEERLGVVVLVDGRLRVIEYSDLPSDAAAERDADGELRLWAGSIAVHVFDVAFLGRMAESKRALPLHRANKRVPYVDEQGNRVEPRGPNAVKFERFIFDLLPQAERGLIVEVDPAEAFAPLKNASGDSTDTPELVRAALVAQATRWLAQAGATVAPGVQVEISPRFALDPEELAGKMERGTTIAADTYFSS